MSSNNVLNYSNGAYKFTAPTWNTYNSLRSTWSMLLSARWYF